MIKTIELGVYGITCDDCTEHVSSGLKNANGLNDVSVSLKDGVALVRAPDTVHTDDIIKLDIFKGRYRAQIRSVEND